MTSQRLMPVLALAMLAACSGGSGSGGSGGSGISLNPFNWFGRSDNRVVIQTNEFGPRQDDRGLVDEITSLSVEQVSDGALVHAVGLPPRQGYWDAELWSDNRYEAVDGVLTLEFRIRPPMEQTRVSTPFAREVTVGLFLTRQKLANIREIRVQAARNIRTVRR